MLITFILHKKNKKNKKTFELITKLYYMFKLGLFLLGSKDLGFMNLEF